MVDGKEESEFLFEIEEDLDDQPTDKSNKENKPVKQEKTRDNVNTNKKKQIKKGGYRPVLVDENSLKTESIELEEAFNSLKEKHKNNLLSEQDLTVLYIIIYLNQRYPNQFLENLNPILKGPDLLIQKQLPLIQQSSNLNELIEFKNKNFHLKLEKYKSKTLFDLINTFNLHSVPQSVRITLVNWYLSNQYRLVLMVDKIPSTRQVLRMQSNGERCVSMITENIDSLIMNERDALSFLLHDLVHAYKMFSDEYLLKSQIGFSRAMVRLLDDTNGSKLIDDLIANNENFLEQFDYLISDMNSHSRHLFYYFKAILINAFKTKFNLSEETLNGQSFNEFQEAFELVLDFFGMNEAEKEISRKMLMPNDLNPNYEIKGFNTIDFSLIDKFFLSL